MVSLLFCVDMLFVDNAYARGLWLDRLLDLYDFGRKFGKTVHGKDSVKVLVRKFQTFAA